MPVHWHRRDHRATDNAGLAAAPTYPAPIVDYAARREEAIAMFEAARGAS